MEHQSVKKYNHDENRADTLRNNWQVMKPFVHFAFKAMTLIGGALIGIIKLLPMLLEHQNDGHKKKDKIIKID